VIESTIGERKGKILEKIPYLASQYDMVSYLASKDIIFSI
jgi:hypothetical protein